MTKETPAERRLRLAEQVCLDLRRNVARRVCDQTEQQWSDLISRLLRWMNARGKHKYDEPEPLRRKKG